MEYEWLYVLNLLVTAGCLIAWFIIDGKELVYTFYIPLDIALNISKMIFFFY